MAGNSISSPKLYTRFPQSKSGFLARPVLSLGLSLLLISASLLLKDFVDRGWLPGFSPSIMGVSLMSADAAIG